MDRIAELYHYYLKHRSVCTDTRQISKDCLFFALKGDTFDGNKFAAQALENGAALAIVDDKTLALSDQHFLVEDVLTALQQLAAHHRDQLSIPFIGLTGSNGKTTTKELINSVLSVAYQTHATKGNLNNHIGVPLTLLSMPDDTEVAIIEMGANHQKEIAMLSAICKPTHGLITNVGRAHLEGFGGIEGVKKGKGELYDFLKSSKGIAFINHDNNELVQMGRERALERVIFYGTGADNYVSGKTESSEPFISMEWLKQDMEVDALPELAQSNLTGSYNAENILAAITIGTFFKLSPDQINKGISDYVPQNNRSQLSKTDRNTLICDYYNANPSSMDAALSNFSKMEAGKKVMILGDMFELGEHSEAEHKAVIEKALALKAWQTLFVGKHFFAARTEGALFFEDTASVSAWLDQNPISQATILVKGSRGMALEKLVGKL